MKYVIKGGMFTALIAAAVCVQAAAKKNRPSSPPEPWLGAKSVVVLPVKNEAPEGGEELAEKVNAVLKQMMSKSRKFSVENVHPFNPSIQRAISERRAISDQLVQAAVTTPTLDNVRPVAQALGWDFVAEVTVKDFRVNAAAAPIVAELTLNANLYDAASGQPVKSIVANTKGYPPRKKKKATAAEVQEIAISNAVNRVIDEFLGRAAPAVETPASPTSSPRTPTTRIGPRYGSEPSANAKKK